MIFNVLTSFEALSIENILSNTVFDNNKKFLTIHFQNTCSFRFQINKFSKISINWFVSSINCLHKNLFDNAKILFTDKLSELSELFTCN